MIRSEEEIKHPLYDNLEELEQEVKLYASKP